MKKLLTFIRSLTSLSFGFAFVGWAFKMLLAPLITVTHTVELHPPLALVLTWTFQFLWLDILALFVSGILLLFYGIFDLDIVIKGQN